MLVDIPASAWLTGAPLGEEGLAELLISGQLSFMLSKQIQSKNFKVYTVFYISYIRVKVIIQDYWLGLGKKEKKEGH